MRNQEGKIRMELLKVVKELVLFVCFPEKSACLLRVLGVRLSSGFWESSCFLNGISNYQLISSSILTPYVQKCFTSLIHDPSWGSENANYFLSFAFPTSSMEFSFFKSVTFNYHLSISCPGSKSFAKYSFPMLLLFVINAIFNSTTGVCQGKCLLKMPPLRESSFCFCFH